MKCNTCGRENADGAQYCEGCGAPLIAPQYANDSYSQPNQQAMYGQQQVYSQQPVYSNPQSNQEIPFEYKPISMWGYFGYELLFSIPCIGFILLLVFSFGGTKNKNLRNFARSYFCLFIIALIIFGIIMACGGAAALSQLGSYDSYGGY